MPSALGAPPNVAEQDSTATTQLTDTQAARTSSRSDIHRSDPRGGNPEGIGASVEARDPFGEAVEMAAETLFKAVATTSRLGLTPGSGVVKPGEPGLAGFATLPIDSWLDAAQQQSARVMIKVAHIDRSAIECHSSCFQSNAQIAPECTSCYAPASRTDRTAASQKRPS